MNARKPELNFLFRSKSNIIKGALNKTLTQQNGEVEKTIFEHLHRKLLGRPERKYYKIYFCKDDLIYTDTWLVRRVRFVRKVWCVCSRYTEAIFLIILLDSTIWSHTDRFTTTLMNIINNTAT